MPPLQDPGKTEALKTCPGLPGRDRTCNPRLRRPVLYPIELRADPAGISECELVGVEGFEPPTSCSQSKRATGLRYTPRAANYTDLSRRRQT
ncbi:protein of unknown function [Thauera humireducens]|nr:protein of unknown function [Thauera humireducens]